MRKLFSVALLSVSSSLFAQSNDAVYAKVQSFQKYYNAQQPDSIYTLLSDRAKQLVPASSMSMVMKQLHDNFGDLTGVKYLEKEGDIYYYKAFFQKTEMQLIAKLSTDGKLDAFNFTEPQKTEQSAEPEAQVSNFVYNTGSGNIYGTLSLPKSVVKPPVVIIIPGSGPTDRNGNSIAGVKANSYKMLSDSLVSNGIATLCYDKRGVGESKDATKNEEDLTFDDVVNDVEGMVKMLQKDSRVGDVILLGHSEGSLIGMIAAQKSGVKKYISIAGPGRPADVVVEEQLKLQSEDMAKKATEIFEKLKKGEKIKDYDPQLLALFRPSIMPYLRSWIKYDPSSEIKKLKMPVLLLQGETDLQVTMADFNKLKTAAPKAIAVSFKSMNHVLKEAPMDRAENMATYTNEKLLLKEGLCSALVKFIKQ